MIAPIRCGYGVPSASRLRAQLELVLPECSLPWFLAIYILMTKSSVNGCSETGMH